MNVFDVQESPSCLRFRDPARYDEDGGGRGLRDLGGQRRRPVPRDGRGLLHAEWDLSEGTLERSHVTCAGHGSMWNLETGEGQWVRPIPPLPVYPVTTEGDDVLVDL